MEAKALKQQLHALCMTLLGTKVQGGTAIHVTLLQQGSVLPRDGPLVHWSTQKHLRRLGSLGIRDRWLHVNMEIHVKPPTIARMRYFHDRWQSSIFS